MGKGVLRAATERRHEATGILHLLDHVGRGRPQRVGYELDLVVLEGLLHQGPGCGRGPTDELPQLLPFGKLGHAGVGQDLLREGAMFLRDHFL